MSEACEHGVADELAVVIREAMARAPEDRLTVRELGEQLRGLLGGSRLVTVSSVGGVGSITLARYIVGELAATFAGGGVIGGAGGLSRWCTVSRGGGP
ncbi:hypothetical protein [Mycobacterium uberis]|uniref:hypothetical protein n=1 Tax=Mycobacterium uberis TaxID=2162698 RepID=UPI000E305159|nr:hypothetical protein [Mycobacterium uberis]